MTDNIVGAGPMAGTAGPADPFEIRRLLVEYCQSLDDGRFDEWIDLFTKDCVFAVMGMTARGRGELRAMVEPVQTAELRGKHLLSEPLIALNGDVASVSTDFVFVSKTNEVSQAGRYYDIVHRNPDRWRIARREIVFTGENRVGFDD